MQRETETAIKVRQPQAALARKITLPLLTLYGLGTTIGAGVYVVIGESGASAGYYLPLAFLIAGVIAGLSAASFAELATRFPVSAGEAAYIREGLGLRDISLIAGLAVAFSGTISSATLLQGGVGYLKQIVGAPDALLFILLLACLGSLVTWGILKSLVMTALLTLVEIAGLLLVILYAPADPITMAANASANAAPFNLTLLTGLSASILLAFFAFIGFEDMVNVIEEVKEPSRTMPRAIALTLIITIVLYIWVALVAVSTVPPGELRGSDAPLAEIFGRLSGHSTEAFSVIAVIAVVNGVIIQLVMASRVLYGLARQGQIPEMLGWVSPTTHTPVIATLAVCLVVLALGLTLSLRDLAQTTSALTLAAFALVNLSLWRLKRGTLPERNVFTIPRIIPILGFLTTSLFLAAELTRRIVAYFG